ncbi:unnamed protein product, partial [Hydatigera taeniaeformis]|uniref:Swi5-dependent recombination DNA repair protein 1 homolog n=1 Tax=Hydatigena taeniaeformis TaxID=6205 RepID=A0A0R3WYI1_HYDTA
MGRKRRSSCKCRKQRGKRSSPVWRRQQLDATSMGDQVRMEEWREKQADQERQQHQQQEQECDRKIISDFQKLAQQEVIRVFTSLFDSALSSYKAAIERMNERKSEGLHRLGEYKEELISYRIRIDNLHLQEALSRITLREDEHELRHFLDRFKSEDLIGVDLLYRRDPRDSENKDSDVDVGDPHEETEARRSNGKDSDTEDDDGDAEKGIADRGVEYASSDSTSTIAGMESRYGLVRGSDSETEDLSTDKESVDLAVEDRGKAVEGSNTKTEAQSTDTESTIPAVEDRDASEEEGDVKTETP